MAHKSQQERAQTSVFLQQEIVDLRGKEDLEQRNRLYEELTKARTEALERRESKIESVQKRNQLLRETIEHSFSAEQQQQKDRLLKNLETAHSETLDDMHKQGEIDLLDKYAQKILPANWNMQTKHRTALGTVAVGGVVGAVLAYKLIKGLFGKAREAVTSAAKSTGSTLLKWGAYALVALGADHFFLNGAARKWLSSLDVVASAKEKIERVGEAVKEKAMQATGAVKEGASQALEKGQQAANWAQDQLPTSSTTPERTQQNAERVEESASLKAAKTGLALQYDVINRIDPTQTSPRPFLNDAREMMDLAAANRVPMGRFIDCMDVAEGNNTPYETLLKETYPETYDTFSDERKKELIVAAKLVVGYLRKFRSQMEQHARNRGQDLRETAMREAVNIFAYASERSQQLAEKLTLSITNAILAREVPNPLPIIKDVLANKKEYADHIAAVASLPLCKHAKTQPTTPAENQKLQEAAARVATFFMTSGDVSINALEDKMKAQGWPENGEEMTIARAVCTQIRKQEFINNMLRSLMVPTDPAAGTEKEKEIARVINTMARNGSMRLRDAFEIYILQESGQLSGVMSFFKTLQLLKENGHQDLAINRYHEVINRFVQIAEEGTESLKDFAEKLGLTEAQAQEVHNVYLLSREGAEEGFWAWIMNAWEFSQRYPTLATAAGLLIGTPAAIIGGKVTWKLLKIRAKWQQTKIIKFAEMTESQVQAFAQRHGVPVEQVMRAREDAKQIRDNITSAAQRFRWPLEGYFTRRKGMQTMRDAKRKPTNTSKGGTPTELQTEKQKPVVTDREPIAAPEGAAQESVAFNPKQYHERMRARIDRIYAWSPVRGKKWRQEQLQQLEDELTTYEAGIRNRPDVPQSQKVEIFGLLSEVGAARESYDKAEERHAEQLEREAEQRNAKAKEDHLQQLEQSVEQEIARWENPDLTAGKLPNPAESSAALAKSIEAEIQQLDPVGDVDVITRAKALLARVEGLQTEIERAQRAVRTRKGSPTGKKSGMKQLLEEAAEAQLVPDTEPGSGTRDMAREAQESNLTPGAGRVAGDQASIESGLKPGDTDVDTTTKTNTTTKAK